MPNNTCCIFGHRTIDETDELRVRLTETIEILINEKNVDTFLFGSKSRFDSLCLELVTSLKGKYPHIKRVYVRAEFPSIDESYRSYLLESYDDTYYPDCIIGAGKAVYIRRNCEMIDNSKFCLVYCDMHVFKDKRKSGTKIALDYAECKGKAIYLFPFSHRS
ncbi:MAG: hypothetical protein IKV40_06155 [Clostridia bacterium]|nr:hypothetical protein [Clostridia bacterium]